MNARILLQRWLAPALLSVTALQADIPSDWSAVLESTLAVPAERGPATPTRTYTMLHAAIFDAVNGIERKYEPCHVAPAAPPGARAEAAAIQAAYTILSTLRPAYQTVYAAQLEASLAAVPGIEGNSESIARGRAWGEQVANEIIAWRANDNFAAVLPPFVGETSAGNWRHVPLLNAPTANLSALVALPFALPNQLMFDPGPPYGFANRAEALSSALYVSDVNEVKDRGGKTSVVRTPDDLAHALYNNACDIASLDGLLRTQIAPNSKLIESSRIFALAHIAHFDTRIMLFRAKYKYAFWRPFQAINYANEVPNSPITQDASWASYLPTPSHPEYPSAHVTLFAATLQVVTRFFGDSRPVELAAPNLTPRTYPSMAALVAATGQCRIDLGFHFRETTETSMVMGRAIGDHLVTNFLTPVHK